MIDREEMTDVAFEMLKLLFFVVTFFLIVNGITTSNIDEAIDKNQLASFFNTLFIFSATTWIDYLSAMKDSIRSGYSYDGKYKVSPNICVLGASIGFVTTFISLACVFFGKTGGFASWGAGVYWVSLLFFGIKSFVITDMIIHIKNDWSDKKSLFDKIAVFFMVITMFIIMAILKSHIKKPELYLLMIKQKMIPCVVILSIFIGILIGYVVNFFFDNIVFLKKTGLNNHKHIPDSTNIIEEQGFLEIQNETDGKMPYDDMEFDWIIKKEKKEKNEKNEKENNKKEKNKKENAKLNEK